MDLKGNGILGRDFLKVMQSRICYKEQSLTFRHAGFLMHKELIPLPELESGAHQGVGVGHLTLTARTEFIVQLPVSAGSCIREGLVEKAEIASGLYLTESLVKVNNGHSITSILNTREQNVELPNPVIKVVELRDRDVVETAVIGVAKQEKSRDDLGQSSRGERVMAKSRTILIVRRRNRSMSCVLITKMCSSCRGTN